ncbi:MAG: hypothetical protein COB38_01035 [Gammaproteobacteria bacterium]|nr:MAG: hypothetical protein COB38_01035 [Gammaproteobacteria bacterium]
MSYLKSIKEKAIKIGLLIVLSLSLQVCSNESTNPAGYDMRNTAIPVTNLTTGGQPSKNDLAKMAKNGVKVIVNLRTKGEFRKFDEKKVVESLGMKYVSIPIGDEKDFNLNNVKLLDEALAGLKSPAVVHCASSNRVGGLLALRENLIKNSSVQDSITFGRKSGMGSSEKTVKKLFK